MNPLRVFCLVACLLAVALASPSKIDMMRGNSVGQSLKPSEWFSVSQLESVPAINEITLERLETMPLEDGARLIRKLYHLSQMNHDLAPSFVPTPANVPVYIYKPNGEKIVANLNSFVANAKNVPNFGDEEVTIFITGMPQTSIAVEKANRNLVLAYLQRYNGQRVQPWNRDYLEGNNKQQRSSSEEDYSESWKEARQPSGNLIVIDLGSTITNFKRFALLDIEKTGDMFGKTLIQLTTEMDIPHEIVHILAQGVAAHVAGAAANTYTRLTGHKLRRITAFDPSRIYARHPNTLIGLSRGDADFVDAIHTSVYGMGTPMRVGDVDFFPNGPSAGVAGADNVVEASMRATRYFTETVRPGYERNFPAVPASSLMEYKNNNGFGKRAYMGIAAEFDLDGDYMLQINAKSPFGKNTPATKQNSYHGVHQLN